MRFKIYFVLIALVFNAGCFSMLIRKDNPDAESLGINTQKQLEEVGKLARGLSTELAVQSCAAQSTKFLQRVCYASFFKENTDQNTCKKLSTHTIAQYTCYFELLKDRRLKRSELNQFCPDSMCLAVYAYRHYGTDGTLAELLIHRERARQIEMETSYQLPSLVTNSSAQGLEFNEVLYAALRTNRAYGLGYDLNFKYNNSELPSIGFGYYNLAGKMYSFDIVISGVQKPAAARLALGAEFKDDYHTRYHLLYAFGVGAKSLGVAPLIEVSSDFNKDHQLVVGIMLLFQVSRKN